jgi:hypothetical protein
MPSVSAPFGFRVANHPSGIIRPRALNGGIASAYGSDIFSGMPVILNTNGTLTQGAGASDIVGVFAGCEYDPGGNGRRVYTPNWVASSTYVAGSMVAYYHEDPDLVYEVQSSATLAATSVGDQADVTSVTAGSTVTGQSAAMFGTLVGAGVQGQFRILELADYLDNAWGDSFVVVRVQIARHQFVSNKLAI